MALGANEVATCLIADISEMEKIEYGNGLGTQKIWAKSLFLVFYGNRNQSTVFDDSLELLWNGHFGEFAIIFLN